VCVCVCLIRLGDLRLVDEGEGGDAAAQLQVHVHELGDGVREDEQGRALRDPGLGHPVTHDELRERTRHQVPPQGPREPRDRQGPGLREGDPTGTEWRRSQGHVPKHPDAPLQGDYYFSPISSSVAIFRKGHR
jgi:hypothetical protein